MQYAHIQNKLLSIAKRSGYRVRFDEADLPDTVRCSNIRFDDRRIIVYYRTALECLRVLAHEIGHIETYNVTQSRITAEARASKWGIAFLKKQGVSKELKNIRKEYNASLKRYCETYDTKEKKI